LIFVPVSCSVFFEKLTAGLYSYRPRKQRHNSTKKWFPRDDRVTQEPRTPHFDKVIQDPGTPQEQPSTSQPLPRVLVKKNHSKKEEVGSTKHGRDVVSVSCISHVSACDCRHVPCIRLIVSDYLLVAELLCFLLRSDYMYQTYYISFRLMCFLFVPCISGSLNALGKEESHEKGRGKTGSLNVAPG
jgi:hypothetical protein